MINSSEPRIVRYVNTFTVNQTSHDRSNKKGITRVTKSSANSLQKIEIISHTLPHTHHPYLNKQNNQNDVNSHRSNKEYEENATKILIERIRQLESQLIIMEKEKIEVQKNWEARMVQEKPFHSLGQVIQSRYVTSKQDVEQMLNQNAAIIAQRNSLLVENSLLKTNLAIHQERLTVLEKQIQRLSAQFLQQQEIKLQSQAMLNEKFNRRILNNEIGVQAFQPVKLQSGVFLQSNDILLSDDDEQQSKKVQKSHDFFKQKQNEGYLDEQRLKQKLIGQLQKQFNDSYSLQERELQIQRQKYQQIKQLCREKDVKLRALREELLLKKQSEMIQKSSEEINQLEKQKELILQMQQESSLMARQANHWIQKYGECEKKYKELEQIIWEQQNRAQESLRKQQNQMQALTEAHRIEKLQTIAKCHSIIESYKNSKQEESNYENNSNKQDSNEFLKQAFGQATERLKIQLYRKEEQRQILQFQLAELRRVLKDKQLRQNFLWEESNTLKRDLELLHEQKFLQVQNHQNLVSNIAHLEKENLSLNSKLKSRERQMRQLSEHFMVLQERNKQMLNEKFNRRILNNEIGVQAFQPVKLQSGVFLQSNDILLSDDDEQQSKKVQKSHDFFKQKQNEGYLDEQRLKQKLIGQLQKQFNDSYSLQERELQIQRQKYQQIKQLCREKDVKLRALREELLLKKQSEMIQKSSEEINQLEKQKELILQMQQESSLMARQANHWIQKYGECEKKYKELEQIIWEQQNRAQESLRKQQNQMQALTEAHRIEKLQTIAKCHSIIESYKNSKQEESNYENNSNKQDSNEFLKQAFGQATERLKIQLYRKEEQRQILQFQLAELRRVLKDKQLRQNFLWEESNTLKRDLELLHEQKFLQVQNHQNLVSNIAHLEKENLSLNSKLKSRERQMRQLSEHFMVLQERNKQMLNEKFNRRILNNEIGVQAFQPVKLQSGVFLQSNDILLSDDDEQQSKKVQKSHDFFKQKQNEGYLDEQRLKQKLIGQLQKQFNDSYSLQERELQIQRQKYQQIKQLCREKDVKLRALREELLLKKQSEMIQKSSEEINQLEKQKELILQMQQESSLMARQANHWIQKYGECEKKYKELEQIIWEQQNRAQESLRKQQNQMQALTEAHRIEKLQTIAKCHSIIESYKNSKQEESNYENNSNKQDSNEFLKQAFGQATERLKIQLYRKEEQRQILQFQLAELRRVLKDKQLRQNFLWEESNTLKRDLELLHEQKFLQVQNHQNLVSNIAHLEKENLSLNSKLKSRERQMRQLSEHFMVLQERNKQLIYRQNTVKQDIYSCENIIRIQEQVMQNSKKQIHYKEVQIENYKIKINELQHFAKKVLVQCGLRIDLYDSVDFSNAYEKIQRFIQKMKICNTIEVDKTQEYENLILKMQQAHHLQLVAVKKDYDLLYLKYIKYKDLAKHLHEIKIKMH